MFEDNGKLYEAMIARRRELEAQKRVDAGCVVVLAALGAALVWSVCALVCEKRESARESAALEFARAERAALAGGAE